MLTQMDEDYVTQRSVRAQDCSLPQTTAARSVFEWRPTSAPVMAAPAPAPLLTLVPYAPPPAPATWHILDFAILTRRVLRIVAANPRVRLLDLDRMADLDTHVMRHVLELVGTGMVLDERERYTLTASGVRTLRTGREKGDALLADRAEAFINHFSDQLTTGEQAHG